MIRFLFRSSAKRSAVALLVLLVVVLLLGFLYIEAVNKSNLKRIEQYRQQVGALTAAELCALSLDRRDPKLFPLQDRSWVEQSDLVFSLLESEESEQQIGLTSEQREQLISAVRSAKSYAPPEVLGLDSPVIGAEINELARRRELPHHESALTEKQQLHRWYQGVEFVESLTGGAGLLIQEVLRVSLLPKFLKNSERWLLLDDDQQLSRIVLTLTQIEPPRQALIRVVRIEMLNSLNLIPEKSVV